MIYMIALNEMEIRAAKTRLKSLAAGMDTRAKNKRVKMRDSERAMLGSEATILLSVANKLARAHNDGGHSG